MTDAGAGADYRVVMTTTDSEEAADRLARGLVDTRLAACVQLTPVRSHYRWEGDVVRASETLLLIKTRSSRVAEVEAYLAEHHPYETPEVIAVAVASGSAGYLSWIDGAVGA